MQGVVGSRLKIIRQKLSVKLQMAKEGLVPEPPAEQ